MDSPLEQGPVGRGDTQRGGLGKALPGKRLVLRHASCGSGTRMTGDNPCLCSGWAVSFMSGSLLSHVFRLVSPQGSRYLRALLCSHLLVLS